MAAPRIWLLIATPRDPATGAAVTIRLAGGGTRGFTQFGTTDWKAGLARPPVIAQRLGFENGAFGERSVIQALQIEWGGRDSVAKALAAYYWRDTPFTLYSGPDGGADAEMAVILVGRMAEVTTVPGKLIMAMADPAVDLAKPVIKATFAGSGGIEGGVELKGQAKWRAWGAKYNVSLRSLDKANNIYVCTDPAFPLQAFDQVYDRGNAALALTIVSWAGSISATLAALIAATAPAGGAAIAPSISCIKWWFANPGKLTCDLRGEIGTGYVDRPADIAARIIGLGAGPAVDAAMLGAARVARNHETGWLIADTNATSGTEITSLLSGVSLWWGLSAAGVVEIGPWEFGAPVATLSAARIDRVQSFTPVSKISIGWKRNETQMARGDIAGVVLYADGTMLDALRPAEANATVLDNDIRNADLIYGSSDWNFIGVSRLPGGPVTPGSFFIEFLHGGIRYAQFNSGNRTPVRGAKKLHFSDHVLINAGGTGTFALEFSWFNALGAPCATPNSTFDLIAGTPVDAWVPKSLEIAVPVGAVSYEGGYKANRIGAPVNAIAPRLSRTAIGADVAVSAEMISLKEVPADYTGAVSSALLSVANPIVFSPKVLRAGVSAKLAYGTSYTLEVNGGTATVDNVTGSNTKGDVSVTAMAAGSLSATGALTITIEGAAQPPLAFELKANPAPAPPSSNKTGSTSVFAVFSSASPTFVAIARVASALTVASDESLYVSGALGYSVSDNSYAIRTGIFKLRYSVAGANIWSDFPAPSPITGSGATPGYQYGGGAEPEWIDAVDGTANLACSKSGLIGSYDIEVWAAVNTTGRSLSSYGTIICEAKP